MDYCEGSHKVGPQANESYRADISSWFPVGFLTGCHCFWCLCRKCLCPMDARKSKQFIYVLATWSSNAATCMTAVCCGFTVDILTEVSKLAPYGPPPIALHCNACALLECAAAFIHILRVIDFADHHDVGITCSSKGIAALRLSSRPAAMITRTLSLLSCSQSHAWHLSMPANTKIRHHASLQHVTPNHSFTDNTRLTCCITLLYVSQHPTKPAYTYVKVSNLYRNCGQPQTVRTYTA